MRNNNPVNRMKNILKAEYLFLLFLGVYAFHETEQKWWIFAVCFFAPDISMLGYAVNSKIGAWVYNFFHHFALAIVVYIVGKIWETEWIEITGIILFSHISFDRVLGYGLKYPDSFHNTHLGFIGKQKN